MEKIIKKKTAATKKAAAHTESEEMKVQAKEETQQQQEQFAKNAEAKAEEDERSCKGNMKSDSVVTAYENDGWYRGHAILSAANEDEEDIKFNNDHVKHDMNEDTNKSENSADAAGDEHLDRVTVNDDAGIVETAREAGGRHRGRLVLRTVKEEDDFTKFHNDNVENNTVDGMERNQAQSRRSESSSTETMSDVAVATARMLGEEHSDRNTARVETDRFQGDGHHARFPQSVTEAGSIVSHVSNSMNEV